MKTKLSPVSIVTAVFVLVVGGVMMYALGRQVGQPGGTTDMRSKAASAMELNQEWNFNTDCSQADPADNCDPAQGWVSKIDTETPPNIANSADYLELDGIKDGASLVNGNDISYYYTNNSAYKAVITISTENIDRIYYYVQPIGQDYILFGSTKPTSDTQTLTIPYMNRPSGSGSQTVLNTKIKFDVTNGKVGSAKIYDIQFWSPTQPVTTRYDGWDFSSQGGWYKKPT